MQLKSGDLILGDATERGPQFEEMQLNEERRFVEMQLSEERRFVEM
jgi:hypothetical protein